MDRGALISNRKLVEFAMVNLSTQKNELAGFGVGNF
jgi:hypothetical protein